MPDYFTGYTNAMPQQTSLADMMNMASGVQQYQQAQQMNPLALQAKQLELQQNQQLLKQRQLEYKKLEDTYGPDVARAIAESKTAEQGQQKGSLELDAAKTARNEQIAVQNSIKNNPEMFMTNGKFDLAKINKIIPTIAPQTAAEQIGRFTGIVDNQAKASSSTLNLNQAKKNLFGSAISAAGYAGAKDPTVYKRAIDNIVKLHPDDEDVKQLAGAMTNLMSLNSNNPDVDLSKEAIAFGQSLMSQDEQYSSFAPKAKVQDIGGKLITTEEQPSVGGKKPIINVTGNLAGKSLAPTVVTNPITNQPYVIGGGASSGVAGGTTNVPVSGQTTQGGGQVTNQTSGQLSQLPNESPANFNARVAQTQSDYSNALDQYNNPKSALGHIPTIQNINNNIMTLLKDQSVNTGAIADYLKNKTNYGALNSKEQELTKYLQQRIQNLSPRTDNDAASKQVAYGSFNLSKEALQEIVRTDNQWLTSQDLLAKGILHNGSNPKNPQNPNYGGVSNFKTQFAPFASNPSLMRYISFVGEKPKVTLDKEDVAAFNKFVGPMSKEERQNLEQQRQQVLKLVNPGVQ